jgi:hypothetical protein
MESMSDKLESRSTFERMWANLEGLDKQSSQIFASSPERCSITTGNFGNTTLFPVIGHAVCRLSTITHNPQKMQTSSQTAHLIKCRQAHINDSSDPFPNTPRNLFSTNQGFVGALWELQTTGIFLGVKFETCPHFCKSVKSFRWFVCAGKKC